MCGEREKLHAFLQWEKTCICLSDRQHIYYLVSMKLKYCYEFKGWDGLLLLNILHNNQLKESGDISNNAIVDLPVQVFEGLNL